ncbi:Hypothetical predicted protein [Cloeon dipterum]|uniref:Uncharacterized protein n=1 Tax=Cloeon dipterum TaxID=197152 RepID=A0A8S1DKV3_9INSE|nr:Hypothetical predicted protein [Cloeon dipterum]
MSMDQSQREEFLPYTSLEERLQFVNECIGDIPAILYAAEFEDLELCQELVNTQGEDVNKRDEHDFDVYHCAALNKTCDLDLLDFFVSCGAVMQRKNFAGVDAVNFALERWNFKFASKLFDLYESEKSFFLHCICRNLDSLKFAFEQDPSVVKVKGSDDEFDTRILKEVARFKDLQTFEWIVGIASSFVGDLFKSKEWQVEIVREAARNEEHGEAIAAYVFSSFPRTLTDKDVTQVFTDVVLRGNLGVARLLVDNGTKGQLSLFQHCVAMNSLRAAKFVHQRHPEMVNTRTVIRAACHADVEMCEWLLGLPKDSNLCDQAPLFFQAVLSNKEHGAEIIRRFESKVRERVNEPFERFDPVGPLVPLYAAMKNENLAAAEALLEMGAHLNVKSQGVLNLLLYCLGINFLEGAKFVYLKDKSQLDGKLKETAMQIAKKHGNQEMKQWLNEVLPPTQH